MTTYDPNPTVTINSIDYTDEALNNVSITLGRNSIIEQPQPGYAKIELHTSANAPLDIVLGNQVTVSIDKGTTGTQDVFNGIVSDIDISLEAYGDLGSIAIYTLTCVGPLAQLNRRTAGALGFSKEYDGTRVLNILTEAFTTSWDDVSPTLTWSEVPNDVTWDNYEGASQALIDNLPTDIDTPGVYELTAYSDGVDNAWELAQDAAQSGRGVLWECGCGRIHYDDYSHRASNTPIELTQDDIFWDGLKTAAQWSEIVNEISISYKNNQVKTARDEESILLYGLLTGSRQTQLENGTDAQTQADALLQSRAYPRVYPESFTIPLHSPTVSDATRDTLAATYCGLPINIYDLPLVFGTIFTGYVESWTWTLKQKEAYLTLNCSAKSETYPEIVWYQIPATTTWASYNPTTKWSDV